MSKEQIANRLRPKITTAQVNRGLQILLELDLIRKKGNWYEVTNQQISTGDEPDQFIVASYHLENMELAKQSITRFESEQREISSSTLTLTPGKAKEAKKLVQEFHRRLFELETNEPGREVYQFNFQMFPLTESKK